MSTSSRTRSRGLQTAPALARRRTSLGQRIFRTGLLILLVGLISVAGTLYFVWPELPTKFNFGTSSDHIDPKPIADAQAAQAQRPNNDKPIFVNFEPFTVTLSQEGRSRILYVGITLQVADKDSETLLTVYQPVVRDRILTTLSRQDPQQVQSPDGRTALATQLAQSLSAPYLPSHQTPEIDQVLFTAFVVQ